MAARGPQNGRRGLERCLLLDFTHSKQLLQNKFYDPSTPSMIKGRDGKKMEKLEKEKWKRMTSIVATNVVGSRPPERRPTGTPHARANSPIIIRGRFCGNKMTILLFQKFKLFRGNTSVLGKIVKDQGGITLTKGTLRVSSLKKRGQVRIIQS